MGTIFAPTCATLSMGFHEIELYAIIRSKFTLPVSNSLKEIKLKELETLLLKHHYPERIIKAGINKALKITQNELRNVKEQEKKKILLFISTFNPNNLKALPIIKQTQENLKTS